MTKSDWHFVDHFLPGDSGLRALYRRQHWPYSEKPGTDGVPRQAEASLAPRRDPLIRAFCNPMPQILP